MSRGVAIDKGAGSSCCHVSAGTSRFLVHSATCRRYRERPTSPRDGRLTTARWRMRRWPYPRRRRPARAETCGARISRSRGRRTSRTRPQGNCGGLIMWISSQECTAGARFWNRNSPSEIGRGLASQAGLRALEFWLAAEREVPASRARNEAGKYTSRSAFRTSKEANNRESAVT